MSPHGARSGLQGFLAKEACRSKFGWGRNTTILLQVINGSLYLVGPTKSFLSRARALQLMLLELQAKFALPDVDFILTSSDNCKTKFGPSRPSGSSQASCDRLVGFPHEKR